MKPDTTSSSGSTGTAPILGMDALQISNESPFGWLWQDLQLADVSLEVVYITCPTPYASPEAELDEEALGTDPDNVSNVYITHSTDAASNSAALNQGSATVSEVSATHSKQAAEECSSIKTFVLHSQVLGTNSSFFRSLLTSGLGSANRRRVTEDGASRLHISVCVDVELADSVPVLVEFFYQHQLSSSLHGSDLLKLMQMADHWQAPLLLAHAASKLVSFHPCSFPTTPAYSLPAVLRDSTAFAAVMTRADSVLLATFGSALDIIKSPVLLKEFMSLPQPAVVAILKSPKLVTDSEESVLLLVSGWCAQTTGKVFSAEQVDELQDLIRYSRLSVPYLTCVCDSSNLPELTRKHLLELLEFHSLPFERQWAKHSHSNPEAWYLPARPSFPTLYTAGVKLKLVVTVDELTQLVVCGASNVDDASLTMTSPSVYSAGFLWTLELGLEDGALWATVCVRGQADILESDRVVEISNGVHKAISIQVEASSICKQQAQLPLRLCQYNSLVTTAGFGVQMTGEKGKFATASDMNWWARFIVNGAVTLTATIRRVEAGGTDTDLD